MERLLVLGTGAGTPINCYNMCAVLENNEKYLLIDTGGGSQVLRQIRDVGVDFTNIHDVFISHKHIDHLLGIFYVLRYACQLMCGNKYNGKMNIYCAKEVREIIDRFVIDTFHEVHIEKYKENIVFYEIEIAQKYDIIGYNIEVLDMYSIEGIQYGFQTKLNSGKIFTFLGDVPCNEKLYDKIKNTDWVLHEVFCMDSEKEIFKPHEKNHSTVKDVCENMKPLGIRNLLVWHTKDNDIENRKELYKKEANMYYDGNFFVPNDLEKIEL